MKEGVGWMSAPIILQVVGYKNAGKTTLVCEWIKVLKQQGYRVGSLKHDAHEFEMDREGTDTWAHRSAGADAVAITSKHQTAFIESVETPLTELIRRMGHLDIILIEGFKQALWPKVVLVKSQEDLELIGRLQQVVAIITWESLEIHHPIPIFSLDDRQALKRWLIGFCHEQGGTSTVQ
jgi:molybdopterin-guanine dinucleotide biosynthesis protein B